jgi:hypothetical protein
MSWAFENGHGHRIDEPSSAEMQEYSKQGKVLNEIDELKLTIAALRTSVQPIENHPDPGSIEDCWNELLDGLNRIAKLV